MADPASITRRSGHLDTGTGRVRSSLVMSCLIALLMLLSLTTVACGAVAETGPTSMKGGPPASPVTSASEPWKRISPREFAAAIAEPGRVTINVHVPDEGSIEGTTLSIPFDQIAAQSQRLPTDRNTPLAIYCRTGRMSAVAAATLSRLGYSDIVELDGGMQAWRTAGGLLEADRP